MRPSDQHPPRHDGHCGPDHVQQAVDQVERLVIVTSDADFVYRARSTDHAEIGMYHAR